MTASFDDNETNDSCGRGAAEQAQAAGAAEGAERPGYAAVRALLDELVATFPACFKPHATPGLPPIKAGIDADILARRPNIDPNLLQAALRVYASGPEYWRGLIAGRPRVDLDGQIVQAVITPEEKAEAERRLAIFDVNQEAARKAFAKSRRCSISSPPLSLPVSRPTRHPPALDRATRRVGRC